MKLSCLGPGMKCANAKKTFVSLWAIELNCTFCLSVDLNCSWTLDSRSSHVLCRFSCFSCFVQHPIATKSLLALSSAFTTLIRPEEKIITEAGC